ncbi:MAG: glycosyl hydrolase, partial [Oscillospiraceae bacterium]|nr:glycosyl hydrolase [Oscillospiraceae bacterium]
MTALPKPLYQDPIYGSPTDPMLLWYPREQLWYLFYTQRRATDQYVGVSWVHGTRIGVATSLDGHKWLYRGTLPDLDIEPGCNTFWAPEIIPTADCFHMFVSYVQGVPTDWDYARQILHYTSNDLWHWTFQAAVDLQSDRVIDACIYQVKPDLYKMWYKDEARDS